jgi:hypothetical protein
MLIYWRVVGYEWDTVILNTVYNKEMGWDIIGLI